MVKGSKCTKRDLANVLYSRLLAKISTINETFELSFSVEKSSRTSNRIEIFTPMRGGGIGRIYHAENCAQASVWLDGYVQAWATAMGR